MAGWGLAIAGAMVWGWFRCGNGRRSCAGISSFWPAHKEARSSASPCRRRGRNCMSPPRTEKPIAVMLVDDHILVRRGFRRMLEDDPAITVVAEAGDGQEAVDLALRQHPDVIVMDFGLPSMNGAT